MDLSDAKISLSEMSDEELRDLLQETRKGRRTFVLDKTTKKTSVKKKSSPKLSIEALEAVLAEKLKEKE